MRDPHAESIAVEVQGVRGIGRITAGDDLAAIIADAAADVRWSNGEVGLAPGDIVVVTSKVVSKAEGRTLVAADREAAINAESVRTLAVKRTPRGTTRITQTRHGLVLAAAGVDASNTEPGTIVLLPVDPDGSARTLKATLEARLGGPLGVIVTDTLGRAWRDGLTDAAIGCAGVAPLDDHRGRTDEYGTTLEMTVVAVADEIAAAADLVKGKASGIPVAVVRGLGAHVTAADGPGARALIRSEAEDLFSLGTAEARALGAREAVQRRRTIRRYTDDPVPAAAVDRAVSVAVTAPAPHHTVPWRFVEAADRIAVLDAMRLRWRTDLQADGFDAAAVAARITRGDLLRTAPTVLFAFVDTAGAHPYPDERRRSAERDLFIASGGAAVQSLCIALAADGLGSAWVSSSMFCADTVRNALGVPETWEPLGCVAIGYPDAEPGPRPEIDLDAVLRREAHGGSEPAPATGPS